jgi:hypothetical protein
LANPNPPPNLTPTLQHNLLRSADRFRVLENTRGIPGISLVTYGKKIPERIRRKKEEREKRYKKRFPPRPPPQKKREAKSEKC